MNKEIAKKWTAALRSGKYIQTKGVLHDHTGYCCLGVLCEIYAEEKKIEKAWAEKEEEKFGDFHFCADRVDVELEILPVQIQRWAGMGSSDGRINDITLAQKNDEGIPFPDIADLIEGHVATL